MDLEVRPHYRILDLRAYSRLAKFGGPSGLFWHPQGSSEGTLVRVP